MQTCRTFLALDLPDSLRDRLEALSDNARTGRTVPWENLHLTLHFLGDQPLDLLEEAHEALGTLTLPAPSLTFNGLGGFGTPARAIVAMVTPDPALTLIHQRTASALRLAGIQPDKRRFRPHVTILRMPNRPSPMEQDKLHSFLTTYAGTALPPFQPQTMTLYRSTLGKDGPTYDPLAEYPLGQG